MKWLLILFLKFCNVFKAVSGPIKALTLNESRFYLLLLFKPLFLITFWGDFRNIRLDILGTRVLWSLLEAHPNEIQSIRTSSPINCEFMNVNLALLMRN